MTAPSSRRRAARGFTLIEILVSILIFSVGILGAIAMHAKLQKATVQNGDRARASMLADEMASLMWARQTTNPADTTLATDYAAWQSRVAATSVTGLPSGVGTVNYNSTTKISTIKVTWRPTTMASTDTANSFVTSVVIP